LERGKNEQKSTENRAGRRILKKIKKMEEKINEE